MPNDLGQQRRRDACELLLGFLQAHGEWPIRAKHHVMLAERFCCKLERRSVVGNAVDTESAQRLAYGGSCGRGSVAFGVLSALESALEQLLKPG